MQPLPIREAQEECPCATAGHFLRGVAARVARAPLRAILLVGCVSLLAGCGTVDSITRGVTGLFDDEEQTPEAAAATKAARKLAQPAELGEFLITHRPRELWSASVGGGTDGRYLRLRPVLDHGRVFAAEFDGDVFALTLEGGRRLWSMDTQTHVTGGPGVGEGLVVVGSRDGEITALSADQGAVLWRAQVTSEVLAEPAVGLGVVVVRSADGKVFGLDAGDGRRRWSYDRIVPTLSLRGSSAPVIAGSIVMIGFDNGRLVGLDLLEGTSLWEANVGVPRGRTDLERMVDIDGDLTVADGTLYVASFQGSLGAYDVDTGEVQWTREISSYSGVAVGRDHVFVSDDAGAVWAIDRSNGEVIWKQEGLRNRSTSAPAVVGEHVVVGDFEGYVHWLDVSTGEFAARERADSSPVITAPLVVEDLLLVYTAGGDVTAYGPDEP
ncbi:MAG TPA: outer membrane protein assembly factor BamB [Gammaproteobacteria bacterium]|nr:outer membrane protein assembly factor BamB [Gammaproteobacteria bacterium]